jgi:hypothetical protein
VSWKAACVEVGRGPKTIGKSAGVVVDPTEVAGSAAVLGTPIRGSAAQTADGLRRSAPPASPTPSSSCGRQLEELDAMAPVLELLDVD